MKKHLILAWILVLALLVSACGGPSNENTGSAAKKEPAADITTESTKPPITWKTFPKDRTLTAQQYFVYNCETQEFITISGDPEERIYPASVTKLFTAYVGMTHLAPSDVVYAGSSLDLVIYNSSVAGLEKGNELTAEMLVEAMLLPSGNDAAYVMAAQVGRDLANDSGLSGTVASNRFVEEMNRQAKLLGMTGTHFANPDGIHKDDHYTTFADLAILGMLALEDPTIRKYAAVSTDTVTFATGEEKTWKNTNAIIDPESIYYCPYAIGLKTGQTPAAGSCLLSAFEYGNTTYLVGVFGCPQEEDRFADTLQLFNEAIT